jgi:hypothetical protein
MFPVRLFRMKSISRLVTHMIALVILAGYLSAVSHAFPPGGFGESKAIKAEAGALRLGSFKFDNLITIFSQAKNGVHAADDMDGLIGRRTSESVQCDF